MFYLFHMNDFVSLMNVVENFSNLSTNVVIIIIIWALHCYTQSNDENMKFSYENSIPSK